MERRELAGERGGEIRVRAAWCGSSKGGGARSPSFCAAQRLVQGFVCVLLVALAVCRQVEQDGAQD